MVKSLLIALMALTVLKSTLVYADQHTTIPVDPQLCTTLFVSPEVIERIVGDRGTPANAVARNGQENLQANSQASNDRATVPTVQRMPIVGGPMAGIETPAESLGVPNQNAANQRRLNYITFGRRADGNRHRLPRPRTPRGYHLNLSQRVGDQAALRAEIPTHVETSVIDPRTHAQNWINERPELLGAQLFDVRSLGGQAGGSQEVFFVTMQVAPTGLSRAELSQWVIANAVNVVKVRMSGGDPVLISVMSQRDLGLHGLAQELAAAATLNGRPFIRVAQIHSTAADHARRIVSMEVVRGPSAYQVADAVGEYIAKRRSGRGVRGLGPRARSIFAAMGVDLTLPRAELDRVIDQFADHLDALGAWYAETTPVVERYSLENGLQVVGNRGVGVRVRRGRETMISRSSDSNEPGAENTGRNRGRNFGQNRRQDIGRNRRREIEVYLVGFDSLNGHNALWSVSEQMWVIIDL